MIASDSYSRASFLIIWTHFTLSVFESTVFVKFRNYNIPFSGFHGIIRVTDEGLVAEVSKYGPCYFYLIFPLFL